MKVQKSAFICEIINVFELNAKQKYCFKNSLVSQTYEWYCIYIKYVYYYILYFHLFQDIIFLYLYVFCVSICVQHMNNLYLVKKKVAFIDT